VTEFAIWDGSRRLAGEVRPREEARRIYDSIVRRRRDPGLLEYAGENLFQASIFPINPRSTKKLELTYTQVLRAENGSVGYRYPLGIGRNAAPVERLSGRVEVRAPSSLRTVYSPSHSVDVRREPGGRRAVATWEAGRGAERRDFQLFYGLADRDVGLSLFTYREPGKDGYFLLLLSPSDEATQREYAAKDVVYVLDTSGSMEDEGKMEKARRALLFGVRGLRPQDRFNVISFAGETRRMETGLIAADRAGRERGIAFVEGLRAVGGTNINDALTEALAQFPRERGGRTRLLVFLTDGIPTVGETDADKIVDNARRTRVDGVRVFTFGVGYDVNTRLLDRVAAENGGTAEYVEPREDLEAKVSSFFDKVNHPVLSNVALDMGGVRTPGVSARPPRPLPRNAAGAGGPLPQRARAAGRDAAAERKRIAHAHLRVPGAPLSPARGGARLPSAALGDAARGLADGADPQQRREPRAARRGGGAGDAARHRDAVHLLPGAGARRGRAAAGRARHAGPGAPGARATG
jgi:Ca-activated chloride channel family protein